MDARQRGIGLLHCNLCCLRSSWLVRLSRYLRREAVFTEAGVQRGGGGDSEEEVREKWSCLDPAIFAVLVIRSTSHRNVY